MVYGRGTSNRQMKNLIVIAVVAALMAISHPARAIVIVTEGANTYDGINPLNGSQDPAYQLTIAYEVTETTGLNPSYSYDYTLTTTPALDLTSFTIGGAFTPVDTQSIFDFKSGKANSGSEFNNNSVIWEWNADAGLTCDTIGFSSDTPPDLVSFAAVDGGVDFNSPALIPAPVPEPSSWALLAGAGLVLVISDTVRAQRRKSK